MKSMKKLKNKTTRSIAIMNHTRKSLGFTLIELLVVVSILAAIAGMTSVALDGYQQDAEEKLTRVEMQRIANAIRRFKEDTGYWPKTGPFSYETALTPTSNSWPSTVSIEEYRDKYFNSDASFWWLLYQPTKYIGEWKTGTLKNLVKNESNGATELLWQWDIDSSLGWHGPYIDIPAARFVINDEISQDGCSSMNIATITASANKPHSNYPESIVKRMPGLIDRFQQNRNNISGEGYCVIQRIENNPNDFKVTEYSGSPYIYQAKLTDLNNSICTKHSDTTKSITCVALRSFGKDGVDNNGSDNSDDIVFILQVNPKLGES